MTLPLTTPSNNHERGDDVQLTLGLPEAQRLMVVLPWLLRRLEDRPSLTPKQRERRRDTHAVLENLLTRLAAGMGVARPADAPADSA
jgi:hypothetical protein